MLLRFSVTNFRCLRDRVELSMARPSLKGNVAQGGDWIGATVRVAGVYGPNASGKSTVLDAIDFACDAVRFSASLWSEGKTFPHHPYALDNAYKDRNSEFQFDLVVEGVRYTYGFESNADGIDREWLHSYPAQRKRVLLDRDKTERNEFFFGRNLIGENSAIKMVTGRRELFLSQAAKAEHPIFLPVFKVIAQNINYAEFSQYHQESRLALVKRLIEEPVLRHQAEALLRFADLGISGLRLDSAEVDARHRELIEKIYPILAGDKDSVAEQEGENRAGKVFKEVFEELESQLVFVHVGTDGDTAPFELKEESSGTTAWLSLALPALRAIGRGGTFLIDEIDSSLHPRLSAALVAIFKDEEINRTGAQLVFTSHDVSLLGALNGNVLDADEVWFTEKKNGATDLFALAEFPVRKNRDNFEKRYLEGRYGAVPIVEHEELKAALIEAVSRG